jgi:hypothetical protein
LTQEELKKLFVELKTLSSETEWVEFKEVPASFLSRIEYYKNSWFNEEVKDEIYKDYG